MTVNEARQALNSILEATKKKPLLRGMCKKVIELLEEKAPEAEADTLETGFIVYFNKYLNN
jgi:hypothetical protein